MQQQNGQMQQQSIMHMQMSPSSNAFTPSNQFTPSNSFTPSNQFNVTPTSQMGMPNSPMGFQGVHSPMAMQSPNNMGFVVQPPPPPSPPPQQQGSNNMQQQFAQQPPPPPMHNMQQQQNGMPPMSPQAMQQQQQGQQQQHGMQPPPGNPMQGSPMMQPQNPMMMNLNAVQQQLIANHHAMNNANQLLMMQQNGFVPPPPPQQNQNQNQADRPAGTPPPMVCVVPPSTDMKNDLSLPPLQQQGNYNGNYQNNNWQQQQDGSYVNNGTNNGETVEENEIERIVQRSCSIASIRSSGSGARSPIFGAHDPNQQSSNGSNRYSVSPSGNRFDQVRSPSPAQPRRSQTLGTPVAHRSSTSNLSIGYEPNMRRSNFADNQTAGRKTFPTLQTGPGFNRVDSNASMSNSLGNGRGRSPVAQRSNSLQHGLDSVPPILTHCSSGSVSGGSNLPSRSPSRTGTGMTPLARDRNDSVGHMPVFGLPSPSASIAPSLCASEAIMEEGESRLNSRATSRRNSVASSSSSGLSAKRSTISQIVINDAFFDMDGGAVASAAGNDDKASNEGGDKEEEVTNETTAESKGEEKSDETVESNKPKFVHQDSQQGFQHVLDMSIVKESTSMEQMYQSVRHSDEHRLEAAADVRRCVQEALKLPEDKLKTLSEEDRTVKVEAIGSTAMGTSLDFSDCDLVVVISKEFLEAGGWTTEAAAEKMLEALKEDGFEPMRPQPFFVGAGKERQPVRLKVANKPRAGDSEHTKFSIDINLGFLGTARDFQSGLRSTKFLKNMFERHPAGLILQILILLLKKHLRANEVKLPSYILNVMVYHFAMVTKK